MRIAAIQNHGANKQILEFNLQRADEARAFHRTLSGYVPTPLVDLRSLAAHLGVGRLLVKDESKRFGLNSFKSLGGSFAMHSLLEGTAGRQTFVTATDGNHGRGVAWAARMLGQDAYVFMPKGSAQERLENIRRQGAHAEILDLQYDDCVRYARDFAEKNGYTLIQDTAWEGYERIPALIMQGYTTMGLEILEQLDGAVPTHIFLQAGVGAMAGAMAGFFANAFPGAKPTIAIVEPDGADCFYRTAKAADGRLHFCGELESIMAGLCCGEPCTLAWDILERYGDYAIACPDAVAANGMRILGNPLPGDPAIISGESGAVPVGLVAALMCGEAGAELGLDENSVVLCISTEGDTDRKNYRDVVWYGAYPGK